MFFIGVYYIDFLLHSKDLIQWISVEYLPFAVDRTLLQRTKDESYIVLACLVPSV